MRLPLLTWRFREGRHINEEQLPIQSLVGAHLGDFEIKKRLIWLNTSMFQFSYQIGNEYSVGLLCMWVYYVRLVNSTPGIIS